MVLRATPVARAVAATPPWPALCASAATCNRRARSSSDGRTASNRSAMGFSSIIPPPYRDHGAARITQPLKAPTDALISGRRPRTDHPLHDAFIAAAQEAGYPYNRDFNGAEQEGVGPLQLTVRGRRRCSAAVAYLNPARSRRNLTVEVHALTHRVLLEGKRAAGIEYSQNGRLCQARAKREVLLCGGTINSPQILQLSGIGPGELLQSLGIPVKHDPPGVAENLQDHIGGRIISRCVDGTVTINEIYHNWLRRLYAGAEWILAGKGPLMTGAAPIGLFVKTRPELDSPDIQYRFLAGSAKAGEPMHPFPGCTLVAIPCRPESRGWLRIRSPDPTEAPAMQPNYLATQGDRDTIVAGLTVIRRIFATLAMQCFIREEVYPGPAAKTDEDLLEHVRATAGTTFHQTSTCMMGPGPKAVVDTSLRVKGTGGAARGGCLGDADGGIWQYQRHRDHDRGEGGGHDPEGGLTMDQAFAGKIALVTGSGKNIGRTIALDLA